MLVGECVRAAEQDRHPEPATGGAAGEGVGEDRSGGDDDVAGAVGVGGSADVRGDGVAVGTLDPGEPRGGGRDADDLVAAVGRREVEPAAGAADGAAEPPVGAVVPGLAGGEHALGVDVEDAQVLLLERGHDEVALEVAPLGAPEEGGPGGGDGGRARGPRGGEVGVAVVAAGRLGSVADPGPGLARPAVVAAGDEEVDLVVDGGSVLDGVDAAGAAGLEGEALRVAVPHRVDVVLGPVDDGVVGGDAAGAGHPQDLAAAAAPVLGERLGAAVAHRHPQVTGVVHLERASVVGAAGLHAPEQDRRGAPRRGPGDRVAEDLVDPAAAAVVLARRAHVEVGEGSEVGVDRHAHDPRLARAELDVGDGDGALEGGAGAPVVEHPDPARPLGGDHPTVGQEGEVPGDDERVGDDRLGGRRGSRHRPGRGRRGSTRRRSCGEGRRHGEGGYGSQNRSNESCAKHQGSPPQ